MKKIFFIILLTLSSIVANAQFNKDLFTWNIYPFNSSRNAIHHYVDTSTFHGDVNIFGDWNFYKDTIYNSSTRTILGCPFSGLIKDGGDSTFNINGFVDFRAYGGPFGACLGYIDGKSVYGYSHRSSRISATKNGGVDMSSNVATHFSLVDLRTSDLREVDITGIKSTDLIMDLCYRRFNSLNQNASKTFRIANNGFTFLYHPFTGAEDILLFGDTSGNWEFKGMIKIGNYWMNNSVGLSGTVLTSNGSGNTTQWLSLSNVSFSSLTSKHSDSSVVIDGSGKLGWRITTPSKTMSIHEVDSSIVVNGVSYHTCIISLGDDATYTPTDSVSGRGRITVDSLGVASKMAYADFIFSKDGTVTLINNTSSIDDADTDGYFCIYKGTMGIVIKNRLGYSRSVLIELQTK